MTPKEAWELISIRSSVEETQQLIAGATDEVLRLRIEYAIEMMSTRKWQDGSLWTAMRWTLPEAMKREGLKPFLVALKLQGHI